MPATILDGNKLAAQIKDEVAQEVRKLAETGRITSELLRELKRVTGHDLTKTAAER